MNAPRSATDPPRERLFLLAMAACCIGPMLAIVVLTSVIGLTIGVAAAFTLGAVAALVCIAVMVQRHRGMHQDEPAVMET